MLANKEFTEALDEAMLQLVRQGIIYPKCSGCDRKLNLVEYFNLFCQSCGDISAFRDSKILYHPIT
jgi:predicted RNA-binding Zn-ribbon protein involved in translation (DUF1610 family)